MPKRLWPDTDGTAAARHQMLTHLVAGPSFRTAFSPNRHHSFRAMIQEAHMPHSPITRRLAAAATVALGAALVPVATAATASAQDPIAITPNTYFVGLVNGKTADAVITVVCPGPVTTGSLGHPVAGQTAEVRSPVPTAAPAGFTGSAGREIVAGFTSASTVVQSIRFGSYFAPAAIPTTWLLPCGGSATMTFVPEPTSPTARSYTVTVTFLNIAA